MVLFVIVFILLVVIFAVKLFEVVLVKLLFRLFNEFVLILSTIKLIVLLKYSTVFILFYT